ncbi:MAG TPA: hypothetical protein GX744_08175 [Firmicutes bacterium]|jgi:hypothetical protein|nr:hypothetical protein [Bacillota bacterium]
MREPVAWLGILLFTVVLLYGGLNLAEGGITAISAPAPAEGAFLVRCDPGAGPGITVIFAGGTIRLYLREIGSYIEQWRDRFSR